MTTKLYKESNLLRGTVKTESIGDCVGTYVAVDADTKENLYIGHSIDVRRRCLRCHKKPSQWMFGNRNVHFYLVTDHSSKKNKWKYWFDDVLEEERNLIKEYQPKYNIQSK
jgi:excinuclease UvrABC nuclease subunit|tara:strand:- start:192 stop:524 length:333 start_codon:yes stop_codon:yes gene_type:complete